MQVTVPRQVVSGRVVEAHSGAPLAGQHVQLTLCADGGATALAEGRTDGGGAFALACPPTAALYRRLGPTPTLRAVALESDRPDAPPAGFSEPVAVSSEPGHADTLVTVRSFSAPQYAGQPASNSVRPQWLARRYWRPELGASTNALTVSTQARSAWLAYFQNVLAATLPSEQAFAVLAQLDATLPY